MQGYVATIGMFDGVHRGHQFVLQHVVDEARQRGLLSMAITFDKTGPETLTPLAQKRILLMKTGIDRIEVLTFDDALKQMTARQFMQQVLRDQYGVKVLLTGYDNRFGHNRLEGFGDYVRYGKELGIEVKSLPQAPSLREGEIASSSFIRHPHSEYCDGRPVPADSCCWSLCGENQDGEQYGMEAWHDEYRHTSHLRRTAPDLGGERLQAEGEPLRTTATGCLHRTAERRATL